MDVNQTTIKINQTSMSNEVTSRNNIKPKPSMVNFDQILSVFSLIGQTTKLNDQGTMPSLQKATNEMAGDPKDLSFETEDLKKLDSILELILAGLQQFQYTSSPNDLSENSISAKNASMEQYNANVVSESQKGFGTYDLEKLESVLKLFQAGNEGIQDDTFISKGNPLKVNIPNLVNQNQINSNDLIKGQTLTNQSFNNTDNLLVELEQVIGKIKNQEKQLLTKNENNLKINLPLGIMNKVQVILDNFKTVNSTLINTNNNNQFLSDFDEPFKFPLSTDQDKYLISSKIGKTPVDTLNNETLPNIDLTLKQGYLLQKQGNISDAPSLTVSNFAPEVSEWVAKFIGTSNGQFKSTETKFSLYPEHLGQIEVKITSHQGQIFAEIVTNTPSAKDALEGQLQNLKQAIQQHGVIVQKLEVVQQPTGEFNSSNLAFSQSGTGSNGQRQFHFEREIEKKQKKLDLKELENGGIPTSYSGIQKTTSTIDFTA